MLSSSANQGLVAVVLRFISRAIRTFHSADLAAAPISWRDLRALRNKAANSLPFRFPQLPDRAARPHFLRTTCLASRATAIPAMTSPSSPIDGNAPRPQ